MKRKLKDAVVVITGASSGIGKATALQLAEQGAKLVLAARREEALEETARLCRDRGALALAVPTDVSHPEEVEALADRALAEHGRIDAWVNDAGISLFSRFEEAPLEEYRRVIETNFFGTVYGSREAIRAFREQGSGVLINMSSMMGEGGAPFVSAYVSSKFAIRGLSESLRQELIDTDIDVVTILPASIDTPLFQHAANFTGRAVKPLEPIYPADDVAAAIVKAIRSPQREVFVGPAGRAMAGMHKVAPSAYEKATARMVDRDHFADRPSEHTSGNLFEPMAETTGVSGGWLDDGDGHAAGRGPLIAATASVALGIAAGFLLWRRAERHDG